MSLIFLVSMGVLLAAIVLIEVRAVRTGDERRHHAPGYRIVLAGLVVIAIGVAAAAIGHTPMALANLVVGLGAIVLGVTRHQPVVIHHIRHIR